MNTVVTISGRVLLLLLVWWALTEGDPSGTITGLVVVALATVISLRLFPPGVTRIHPVPFLFFVMYFLLRSVTAGIDVARRLLSPALPVAPGYLAFHVNLPSGGPRWLLANTLSLMPGTLSVSLDGEHLLLHCLDTREPVEADVRAVEQRVARIFGLPLSAGAGPAGTSQ
ncbi:Na+/H+ antiporter subunit E [Marinobacter sp. HL-58]|uniref:Na+/H+ antiporter subunit E n=1 Tax=Marinobacter sp. HL-58 TaxID=1479237 RepID=UPI00068BFB47|nr:Na+/H+ antiporter subunit E [Marinobacter sp. HL-58]KPQ03203.1 MAG: multicomponent Na+:H+ antiporter subunit E [Marinobacter sp. HL-58]